MNVLQDLAVTAPIWCLLCTAMVVLLLVGAFGVKSTTWRAQHHFTWVALVGLGVVGCLLWQAPLVPEVFAGALVFDGLSRAFGLIVCFAAFLTLVLANGYLHEQRLAAGEFVALILLATAGIQILVMANDLLVLFVGLEIMSIAAYAQAGYRRDLKRSQEAALKYFVYGAFASAFMLYGMALLYGEIGRVTARPTLQLAALHTVWQHGHEVSALGWLGTALVFCGLAFKMAAVPFHMWAPDVYEGAPTPTTAWLSVGVKAAALAALCRLLASTWWLKTGSSETFVQLVELLAILTMVLGNVLAFLQQRIKRMLAYSSIAHAGYLLVGVVAWLKDPNGQAMLALLYYVLVYTTMTLGALGVVMAFERRGDERLDISIDRLAGVGRRYPALGLAMVVFMLALAGIPPTAGFFGKFGLVAAAVAAERLVVAVVMVLTSAIGAVYYLRVLALMYMRDSLLDEPRVRSAWLMSGLSLCAILTLVAGFFPGIYLNLAKQALANWGG